MVLFGGYSAAISAPPAKVKRATPTAAFATTTILFSGRALDRAASDLADNWKAHAEASSLTAPFVAPPKSTDAILKDLSESGDSLERAGLAGLARETKTLLSNLGRMTQRYLFFPGAGVLESLPIFIGRYRDEAYISLAIGSTNVLNSFRLSARQRVSMELSKDALPALREVATAFEGAGVLAPTRVAIALAYGTRDFVREKDERLRDVEVLILMVDASDALAFSRAEISDQALVDKASVLLREQGADRGAWTRINPRLE